MSIDNTYKRIPRKIKKEIQNSRIGKNYNWKKYRLNCLLLGSSHPNCKKHYFTLSNKNP